MSRAEREMLSRREREIMDILYRNGESSASEVQNQLADTPSYSATRTFLTILANKGHVQFRQEGRKYIYRPCRSKKSMGGIALKKVISTFYDGSPVKAFAGLLESSDTGLTPEDYQRLSKLIKKGAKGKK